MKIILNKSKNIFILCLILTVIFTSCASTSNKTEESIFGESGETVDSAGTGKKSKKEKKSKKNKEETEQIPANENETSEEQQNFVGWVDTSNRPVSFESGIIKIRALPSLGSFNIAAVTPNDKLIPVLSTANEYSSTSFYLQTEKKIYKLTADSGIKTAAIKTNTGIAIKYTIKKVAEVIINFDCFSSDENHDTDMIKLTAQVTNLSSRKSKLALKAVFDTVLGESYRNHFYTTDGMPVKNEMLFTDSSEDSNMERWIISRNATAALQIFLRGTDVSRVEQMQLANYQTLDTRNWYPNLLSYRTFDTVRSYNNSAIGINWPASTVNPSGKIVITSFMALALDEAKPNGAAYIYPEEVVETVPVSPQTVAKEVEMKIPELEETDEVISIPELDYREASEVNDTEVPVIKFDVATLTAEQLEPEYIQNLINRITVLEESGLAVNRAELLQLNAELDAILEILRQN